MGRKNRLPHNGKSSKWLAACDYSGLLGNYKDFLFYNYGLQGKSLYKILAHRFDSKAMNSICAMLEDLASPEPSDVDLLSSTIYAALKNMSIPGVFSADDVVNFKTFFSLFKEKEQYLEIANEDIFYRVLLFSQNDPSSFEQRLFSVIMANAPDQIKNHCSFIANKPFDRARDDLFQCVTLFVKSSILNKFLWAEIIYPNLEEIIRNFLQAGQITNWQKINELISQVQTNIVDVTYDILSNKYGTCIAKSRFISMLEENKLSITKKGKVKIEASWSEVADLIVDHCLTKAKIVGLAPGQIHEIEKKLSSIEGPYYSSNFVGCDASFGIFQTKVQKLVFSIVTGHKENQIEILEILSSFLKKCDQNVYGESDVILTIDSLQAWFNAQIKNFVTTQEPSTELLQTNATSLNSSDSLTTLTTKNALEQERTNHTSEYQIEPTDSVGNLLTGRTLYQMVENHTTASSYVNYTNPGIATNNSDTDTSNHLMIARAVGSDAWNGTVPAGWGLPGLVIGIGGLGYGLYQKCFGSSNETAENDYAAVGQQDPSLVGDVIPDIP